MRNRVEQLNIAIIAVLVATAVPESTRAITDAEELRPTRWPSSTPAGIDTYLLDLTGFTGWRASSKLGIYYAAVWS